MGPVVVIYPLEGKLTTLVGDGAIRGDGHGCFGMVLDMVEGSMEFGAMEMLWMVMVWQLLVITIGINGIRHDLIPLMYIHEYIFGRQLMLSINLSVTNAVH